MSRAAARAAARDCPFRSVHVGVVAGTRDGGGGAAAATEGIPLRSILGAAVAATIGVVDEYLMVLLHMLYTCSWLCCCCYGGHCDMHQACH